MMSLWKNWSLLDRLGAVFLFLTDLLGLALPPEPADWDSAGARTRYYQALARLLDQLDAGLKRLKTQTPWPEEFIARVAAVTDPPDWFVPFLEELAGGDRLRRDEPVLPGPWDELAQLLHALDSVDAVSRTIRDLARKWFPGRQTDDRDNLARLILAKLFDVIRRNAHLWARKGDRNRDWRGWVLEHLRSIARRKAATLKGISVGSAAGNGRAEGQPGGEPSSPPEEAARHEQKEQLHQALRLLPPEQRDVIKRTLEDETIAQIARELNRKKADVQTLHDEAVASLRAILSPHEGRG